MSTSRIQKLLTSALLLSTVVPFTGQSAVDYVPGSLDALTTFGSEFTFYHPDFSNHLYGLSGFVVENERTAQAKVELAEAMLEKCGADLLQRVPLRALENERH